MSDRAARLIVTVDTEEEGLWGGAWKVRGNTVADAGGIPQFQEACEEFGVRPTYLVDTPIVEDDRAVEILAPLHEAGRCEIGAHLHPWCAPPYEETVDARHSYMCNLPESLQREKLAGLTGAIEDRFGRRPTSFRAGRYGFDTVGARLLGDLGYLVDSSVLPFYDYSDQGGPDFRRAPYQPYRVSNDDLTTADASGTLLEVPVSVGFSRRGYAVAQRLRDFGLRNAVRPFRLIGILDRLNLVRRIKFCPEQTDAAGMRQLTDTFLANGAACMVMMLHSSSLVAGHSPYAADEAALRKLYDNMRAAFDYCRNEHGMVPATLTEFALSLAVPTVTRQVSEYVG